MKRALLITALLGLLLGPASAQSTLVGNVSVISSGVAEKSHVLKSKPGYLASITVTPEPAAAGWVMLYERTAT